MFSSALTALNPPSAMASSWLSACTLKRWRSCWGLTFLEAGLTCVYGPCRYCCGPRLSHGFLGGITPKSSSATGRGVCVCTQLLPLLGFVAVVLRDRTQSSRQRFPLRPDTAVKMRGSCAQKLAALSWISTFPELPPLMLPPCVTHIRAERLGFRLCLLRHPFPPPSHLCVHCPCFLTARTA